MANRVFAGSLAGLVLVFATACGGGGATPSSGPGSATPRPTTTAAGGPAAESCTNDASGDTVITVDGYEYPAETRIAAGTSVTWTNEHNNNHTVSFKTGPDCGMMLVGQSVTVQFDTPGTYEYVCKFFFSVMYGKVIVE